MRTEELNKSKEELAQSKPCKKEGNKKSTMTKSTKRAFILFWHGLTALLAGIANWLTEILDMRDDSKYGKFLRRTMGSCIVLLLALITVQASIGFYDKICYRLHLSDDDTDAYCEWESVSYAVNYYKDGNKDGFLKTSDGKKSITGIKWIERPLGKDSLVCYSDGKKRGYFNMFTGKPVIEPKYDHAWIFSEGLASVDDGGYIKFIDATGKVVIDLKTPYCQNTDGYVFHNGYCIMDNGHDDQFGLIDKEGKWVLKPEYVSIEFDQDLWIVNNGKGKCVLDSTLNTVIPFTEDAIWISTDYICVTRSNNIVQHYDYSGQLIHDSYISEVRPLTYKSDELMYVTHTRKYYNSEGILEREMEETIQIPVVKTARCRYYEAGIGNCGLITADGKTITPPSYSSIEAIGYDLYLCKDSREDGIILNGKGEPVK